MTRYRAFLHTRVTSFFTKRFPLFLTKGIVGPVYTVRINKASSADSDGGGPLVVTGGGDDRAFLWDLETGEQKAELKGHSDSIVQAGFSFDGKLVATAGLDSVVKVIYRFYHRLLILTRFGTS